MERFIREKIQQTLVLLEKRMVKTNTPLDGFLMKECGYKEDNTPPMPDKSWTEFEADGRWGKEKDKHCWFYKKIKTECDNTYFSVRTGWGEGWNSSVNPQLMVYLDGKLVQGMDTNHTEVLIEKKGEYDLHAYAYSSMEEGYVSFQTSLKTYDERVRKLYYDIRIPYEVCLFHDKEEKVYIDIMTYLESAVNLLDFRKDSDFEKTVDKALSYMEKEFYGKFCSRKNCEAEVVCIGHTHIDVAWLWTLAQTREKALRSFSTVIKLMKQYPEYKFMSSQAQLYKYVKEQAPDLYEDIKEMVRQGRWEVEGSMWVEADCNLSSGESLVRQVMFGKRFFKEEFGVDNKILWLPDVFGYSAALPQILTKSGVEWFLTSKISWSEINTMPNDTFMWRGIDGTEIKSYFLTAQDKILGQKPVNYSTYNGELTPRQVTGTWDRYQNKDINNEAIITFGWGDGGGGPTAEMLENARRLEYGIPGAVSTRMDTAGAFLDKLAGKMAKSKNVPKWVGELYLELHRGTYTSMAKNKKNNRKSEYMYQSAESLSVLDTVLNNNKYPQKVLNDGWELILLNQFHDIIPGSSIKEVYEDSDKQYAEIAEKGNCVINTALSNIAKNIETDGGLLVYNPLSFKASGVVEVGGRKVYVQNIPAKGYKVVKNYQTTNSVKVSENLLENKFFKIKLKNGDITSIYDKKNHREVVKKGERANVLRAFEDYPKGYDNWEITSYYKDKMWEVSDVESVEPFDDGVCAGLKIRRRFLNSVIEQKICLYDEIARIDFDTYVDWKQDHVLLKAFFPVDVHADKATYDIQFGSVERPTHKNTSWDEAKFEVCAHKFADVSEDDYGVSILNDCKYGHSISGNDMSITLIKSGEHPNPDADKCEHYFTYSLYPHTGNHKSGGTVKEAFKLNIPMYAMELPAQKGTLKEEYSLVRVNAENVIIDTVKKAEDSDGIVVRMYEAFSRRTKAKLDFGFDVKRCYIADLGENKIKELKVKDNSVELEVKPFELVTVMTER